ncbi:unnamed protein product [Victoria cruziana]
MELIKFNLFDNNGTYADYALGRDGVPGPALKTWPQLRLPPEAPAYAAVGGAGPQLCQGELIRARQLDGICNDLRNPLMGATGTPFARNVQFEATFPDLGRDELARNRHGDRLALLKPDPQLISRKLFTRAQSHPELCHEGQGLPGDDVRAQCDYKKAPFFNVLAAFWIQFMTHDWFSHLDEGHNAPALMPVGCPPEQAAALGCRPEDRIDASSFAATDAPPRYQQDGRSQLARAYKTTANTVTAWWDASQLYGYDARSRQRVKRDPADPARLLLQPGQLLGAGEVQGYLPVFQPGDPIAPQWAGQEAAAFPDNWSIGTSFYHNVFAREHNAFVAAFRRQASATPEADSGLRNPARPGQPISYREVSADELFEMARLVVAAEIAKIHTIEWTPQLLYGEPLYLGMNANWDGLFARHPLVAAALEKIVVNNYGKSEDAKKATQWYSALASGPGIFGLGSRRLPPACAGARPARIARLARAECDPRQGAGTEHLPRQGHAGHARARPGQLGAEPGPPAPGPADAAEPAAVPAEPGHQPRTGRHPQDRRGGAGPDPRPRARRAALQRVPPPVRPAPAARLRRFRRPAPAGRLGHPRRATAPGRPAARGLRQAPLRCEQAHHRGPAQPRRHADQRLPGPARRQPGRQYRGRRHRGRLALRVHPSAWLRDLGNAVPATASSPPASGPSSTAISASPGSATTAPTASSSKPAAPTAMRWKSRR